MELENNVFNELKSEEKKLFGIIRQISALTKNDLLAHTGIKLTTLNRMMTPLIKKGLIMESGIGESSGGRKPSIFSVNPNRFAVVGVDISRKYARVAVINLAADILYERAFTMTRDHTPQKTVEEINGIINEATGILKLKNKEMLGIGVGCVGPIERDEGVILNPAHFESQGWLNVPLKKMLMDASGLNVILDNGANTALIAEARFGIGRSNENIVYINCGIGIRTAATNSGVLVRSMNNSEDAFAHMIIDVDGEACDCGNYGCIEAYSSGLAIVRNYTASIKKGRNSIISKNISEIEFTDICEASEKGDVLCSEIITEAAVILGSGIANYINLLNPGMVIISGLLVRSSELYYRICTETALKKISRKTGIDIKFSKGGNFKEKAISVGAAVCFIDQLINN